MKFAVIGASFLGGLVACYLLFSLGMAPKLSGIPVVPNDAVQSVSLYLTFIGVMLSAVTVVLTALAIGIGIVAAYTFSDLRTEARSCAHNTAREISESTAKEIAADALSDIKIKAIVEGILAVNITESQLEADWGTESEDDEER